MEIAHRKIQPRSGGYDVSLGREPRVSVKNEQSRFSGGRPFKTESLGKQRRPVLLSS
jgi:hypothetical protein